METYLPIVISVLALLVSGLSMWISFLVYRRAVQREQPLLTAKLTPFHQQPGWFKMNLRLESRSTHGWRCDVIRFMTWGARGMTWGDYGDVELIDPPPMRLTKKTLPLNMEVTRGGVPGESHTETLFVFVPPSKWRKTLFMRASLRSIEPIERTTEIAITRRLPER